MVIVIGDVHGRTFWKESCKKNVSKCDRIIFLGDYLDPYGFEGISVEDAIKNFKEIIEFKKDNMDKVILLIGNHDCPYYSKDYFNFSSYHCRHSSMYHDVISNLFKNNLDLFKFAHVENDVLFTHAGVESRWLKNVIKYDGNDIYEICEIINNLPKTREGLSKLFYITSQRGGRDRYGSCIWTDVNDMMWDNEYEGNKIKDIKQVFGHTIQAFRNFDGSIEFGSAIEFGNCKMIDTANAYELRDNFTLKQI